MSSCSLYNIDQIHCWWVWKLVKCNDGKNQMIHTMFRNNGCWWVHVRFTILIKFNVGEFKSWWNAMTEKIRCFIWCFVTIIVDEFKLVVTKLIKFNAFEFESWWNVMTEKIRWFIWCSVTVVIDEFMFALQYWSNSLSVSSKVGEM